MNITGLSTEQIVSVAQVMNCKLDYLVRLDYDYIDWLEWASLNRN